VPIRRKGSGFGAAGWNRYTLVLDKSLDASRNGRSLIEMWDTYYRGDVLRQVKVFWFSLKPLGAHKETLG